MSAWIIVPAPNYFLYPLAVGAPEISPVLLAAGLVLLVLTATRLRPCALARVGLAFAVLASSLALVPLVQLPFALARFNRAMSRPPPNRSAS